MYVILIELGIEEFVRRVVSFILIQRLGHEFGINCRRVHPVGPRRAAPRTSQLILQNIEPMLAIRAVTLGCCHIIEPLCGKYTQIMTPDKTTGGGEMLTLVEFNLLNSIAGRKIAAQEGGGLEVDNEGKVPERYLDILRGRRDSRRIRVEATGNFRTSFPGLRAPPMVVR